MLQEKIQKNNDHEFVLWGRIVFLLGFVINIPSSVNHMVDFLKLLASDGLHFRNKHFI